MSSHTSTTTTRDATQNASPRPLRDRSWNELDGKDSDWPCCCTIQGGGAAGAGSTCPAHLILNVRQEEKLVRSVSTERFNDYKYTQIIW